MKIKIKTSNTTHYQNVATLFNCLQSVVETYNKAQPNEQYNEPKVSALEHNEIEFKVESKSSSFNHSYMNFVVTFKLEETINTTLGGQQVLEIQVGSNIPTVAETFLDKLAYVFHVQTNIPTYKIISTVTQY